VLKEFDTLFPACSAYCLPILKVTKRVFAEGIENPFTGEFEAFKLTI
jgi:hypothetical protein